MGGVRHNSNSLTRRTTTSPSGRRSRREFGTRSRPVEGFRRLDDQDVENGPSSGWPSAQSECPRRTSGRSASDDVAGLVGLRGACQTYGDGPYRRVRGNLRGLAERPPTLFRWSVRSRRHLSGEATVAALIMVTVTSPETAMQSSGPDPAVRCRPPPRTGQGACRAKSLPSEGNDSEWRGGGEAGEPSSRPGGPSRVSAPDDDPAESAASTRSTRLEFHPIRGFSERPAFPEEGLDVSRPPRFELRRTRIRTCFESLGKRS